MPTYQYQCTECGEGLEAVQKFTDDPLTDCPSCSGRLRKVFNSVGIVFKGSGFYRTDSRSGSGSTTASNGNGSKDAKESSGSKESSSSSSSSEGSSAKKESASSSSGSSSTAKKDSAPAA